MTSELNNKTIESMSRAERVAMAMDLAQKKGTKEDKERSKTAWKKLGMDGLAEALERLLARDAKGKVVHLSDVSGAVCLKGEVSVTKLLTMPTTTIADEVTCKACREGAMLDSEGCELCGTEGVAVRQHTMKKGDTVDRVCDSCILDDSETRRSSSGRQRKATPKAKINLEQVPDEGLPVVYKRKGVEHQGTLFKTGEVKVGDETHKTASAAAVSISGMNTNGWKAWTFEQDGAWLPIGALRGDEVRTRGARTPKDPAAALAALKEKLVKAEARVQRALNARAELVAKIANLENAASETQADDDAAPQEAVA